jgi:preprotein translocase subunit SecF
MTSTNVNFLKYSPFCFALSFLLFVSFIGGVIYKKNARGSAFIYSVDFTGGTQVLLNFSQPVKSEKVLSILEKNDLSATAREFSSTEVLVRVKEFESDATGLADRLKGMLERDIDGVKVTIEQTDSVGPGIGADLRRNSVWAVLIALLGMLLYIGWRFWSFSFAVGSVFALLHDTVVILSLVLWFDYEISMDIISAVLFILGYSINDTIVIFARIRENLFKKKTESIRAVVNRSINETLSRTILTSLSTCLVVASLLIFGGEALRILSLALLVGMIFGTYSSIYIASPVMLMLHKGK